MTHYIGRLIVVTCNANAVDLSSFLRNILWECVHILQSAIVFMAYVFRRICLMYYQILRMLEQMHIYIRSYRHYLP
jgi:hypothetical protein